MKKQLALVTLLLSFNGVVNAQEATDLRQLVEMPPQMKEMFLKNMRGHMESLDLVIEALAENDLAEAANIAETTMGVGHGKKRQCDESGSHKEYKSEHKKKAFGQFMPAGMKAMGMQLHIAADDFAEVARQGEQGDAYKALRQITATCVACHQSFQVK